MSVRFNKRELMGKNGNTAVALLLITEVYKKKNGSPPFWTIWNPVNRLLVPWKFCKVPLPSKFDLVDENSLPLCGIFLALCDRLGDIRNVNRMQSSIEVQERKFKDLYQNSFEFTRNLRIFWNLSALEC